MARFRLDLFLGALVGSLLAGLVATFLAVGVVHGAAVHVDQAGRLAAVTADADVPVLAQPDAVIPPDRIVSALVSEPYRWLPAAAVATASDAPAWLVSALGPNGGRFVPDGYPGGRRAEYGRAWPLAATVDHEQHHAEDWRRTSTPGAWDVDAMEADARALAARTDYPEAADAATRALEAVEANRQATGADDRWHLWHYVLTYLDHRYELLPPEVRARRAPWGAVRALLPVLGK